MNRITLDENRCCGCGACGDICPHGAITLRENDRGFLTPEIDEKKCTHCGLCSRVCPFQTQTEGSDILSTYAFQHSDRDTLLASSSGGAFTALSDAVLAQGGVIVGTVMDADFTIHHRIAENAAERDAMQGSKYVQSDTRGIFRAVKELLAAGRTVMFVGTPCQAAAMRACIGREEEKLLLVDFLCHGVPSNALFKAHVRHLEKRYGKKVTGYAFRRKHLGWDPAHTECAQLEGSTRYLCREDMQGFTRLYNASLTLREGCFGCPYRSEGRFTDLTLADFWGIEKITGKADKAGVSLVAVGSEKGAAWLEKLPHGLLTPVLVEKVLHRFQRKPVKRKDAVDGFHRDCRQRGYAPAMAKYTATGTMKSKLRFLLKKIKRKVFDVAR